MLAPVKFRMIYPYKFKEEEVKLIKNLELLPQSPLLRQILPIKNQE